ncbi:gag-pol polyprotein [Trichonephila clavata]|uniref:Gag-pol polyprotein n=1 Tax=Trichonephila clavata TaxID=2740835 RepID=A0A8X6LD28_TRICU|nr:gag-pol polyprotein [Trichonephila clavata]
MQSILSVSSETLENLAKLADKIAEVRTDPFLNVSVMDKSTSSNPELPINPREDLTNPLYQEIVALRQQVDALSQQFQRFSGWKSRNRSRTRSNFSRNTTRSLERERPSEICYYHSIFGRHEKRCRSPCSDVSCLLVPEMFKKLSPEQLQLFAANNSNILTYGSKLLNIELGLRRNFSWKFLIASVPIPIIGAHFLENFGLLVDLKRRKLIDSVNTLSISDISAVTDIISVRLISDDTYYHRLLSNFPDLIKLTPKGKQACHNTVHYIETTGPPIHSKPRRSSPKIYEAVKHEFQFMLEQGMCRPSKSPWSSPLHVVAKSSGSIRPVRHLVTKNCIKPLPDKVDPILNYPQPKTVKELRRFLGLLKFFRRFLPRAAHNQTHLNDFLKGLKRNDNRKINWSEQAKSEFQKCKALLASDFAIGGALFQTEGEHLQPLAFFSRKLSETEKGYSAYDRVACRVCLD